MIKKIVCLTVTMCMLISFACFAVTEKSLQINADEPFVSYTKSGDERTSKLVSISGTLSHGLSERVGGTLKNSSGSLIDAAEVLAEDDGNFTLSFVLDSSLAKGTYTITVSSANCALPVSKTVELSAMGTESKISKFSLGSRNATISGKNISLTLSSYTNLKETVPTFTVSDGASVYIGNELQTSGTSKVNFANREVTYRVVSEDLKSETSYTVTVKNPTSSGSSGKSSGGGGSFSIGGVNEKDKEIFTDLSGYEWAEEYIEKLYNKGIVSGDGTGRFYPGKNVSREEFVKMIVLAFGLSGESEISFEDVPESHWAYQYIKTGFASGIINGVSATSFGAGNAITRQDMAVIAYRAAMISGNLKSVETESVEFADSSDISEYAAGAVDYMSACGVINGTGNNNFSPLKTATRSEAAKIICLMTE